MYMKEEYTEYFVAIATALFIAAFFMFPLITYGATISELRAQISTLFNRIQTLQSELDVLGSGGTSQATSPSGPTVSGGGSAGVSVTSGGLSLARQLDLGDSGEDVTRLQQFLARDTSIYPEGLVTGYYGTLTEAAVERFQARCGIVSSGSAATTGYGRIGPSTIKELQSGCGGGDAPPGAQVGGLLRITPVSGATPLTVTATATVNTARSCSRAVYTLDFGDGTTSFQLVVPDGRCTEMTQNISHTYQAAGTYTATLSIGSHRSTVRIDVGGVSSGDGQSNNETSETSQAPLSVTPTNDNPLAVTPVSGGVPLLATAHFFIRGGDPYEIDWGDGSSLQSFGSFAKRQNLPYESTVFTQPVGVREFQHTYTIAGGHVLLVKSGRYEREGNEWVWRVRFFTQQINVTQGDGSSGSTSSVNTDKDSITASPITGETPLTVSFDVVINARRSCDGGSYAIDFNDGDTAELTHPAGKCDPQTFKVTHRYDDPGEYSVHLYTGPPSQIGNASSVGSTGLSITQGEIKHGEFAVAGGIGGDPMSVQVQFGINGSACTSYRVSWGDGSASEEHDAGSATTCASDSVVRTFEHTYDGTGTYTIKLERGRGPLSSLSAPDAITATVSIAN